MQLSDEVTFLKGVGPQAAQKFAVLGIHTIDQLIDYYPRRYDDFSTVTDIKAITPGAVTIKAVIKQATGRYARRGLHVTEAIASDETDSVRLVWFNQPYRAAALKTSQAYYISGNYELNYRRFSIMNPAMELVSEFPINTARITAVYRETKGLASRVIRQAVAQCLPLIRQLPETLPDWLIKETGLISYAAAIEKLHFPDNQSDIEVARARLAFEEVFQLSLASLYNKYEFMSERAPSVPFVPKVAANFTAQLPYMLTAAQKQAVMHIYQDMEKTQPMNRLVEGDVGSGKTVVAAMAALMVLHHGHQVALMAPTELLARQHAETLYRLLEPTGLHQKVGLLVGSLKKSQKLAARDRIASGDATFIIGTQALIQETVNMKNLELVVIDEQHRFGVDQRKKLQVKAGHMPHVLSLTATPIPRSLALTLYGELDVTVLDEKPPGRTEIVTTLVPPSSRLKLYKTVDAELAAGRQAFVVCPLISENDSDGLSAEAMFETLSKGPFKQRRVGLLHGKLPADQKNAIMEQFVRHELDILVSTTVIEVGVDVPNATVMLIEGVERFGLAQLHQLRGRVGRGQYAGSCYLMLSTAQEPGRRLKALENSTDGFKLAELDLQLRGPGAIYGTMQHGQLDLRIAKLSDTKLTAQARRAAQAFIDKNENLLQYQQLSHKLSLLRAVTNLN